MPVIPRSAVITEDESSHVFVIDGQGAASRRQVQLGYERAGMIEVRNKIDLMDDAARMALMNATGRDDDAAAMSAKTGEGAEALLALVDARLGIGEGTRLLRVPVADGAAQAWLHARMRVLRSDAREESVDIEAAGEPEDFQRFFRLFPDVLDVTESEDLPRVAE